MLDRDDYFDLYIFFMICSLWDLFLLPLEYASDSPYICSAVDAISVRW